MGVISVIISTSSIPANSIELNRVVVSGGIATAVTDKRLFLANIMVGLDAAKTATPIKNQVYIATDTEKLYICFVDGTWDQVIPYPNMITKTGDFTAGKLVKINNASGIVEEGTNTDAEVSDAVTKKHTQNTDAHLGTVDQDIPMNTHKFTGLSVPSSNGDSIRATTKVTEENLEDAVDKKHTQGTDQKLDEGGANEIAVSDLKANLVNQVLTSGTAISWDMTNGSRATLVAEHNFTITITKLVAVLKAVLIVTQDGTGSRLLDEIITQKDDSIATTDVHEGTDTIDIGVDIPTGARIRFKTSVADLPDPLVVDTIYYAIRVSATEIKVAISKADAFGDAAINITDAGTGTHEVQQLVKWPGGTLGVLQTAAGGEDIVKLHYKTADEQWYAELVPNFS